MDASDAVANSAGQLIRKPSTSSPGAGSTPAENVRREVYVWRPSRTVVPFVPTDFEIPFVCIEFDGVRRFCPSDPAASFCNRAAMAGQAIRESLGGLSPEMRATFNRMRLLFQLGPRLRERLRLRSFTTAKDLWVKDKFAVGSRSDILPDDFGGAGPEDRWSVNQLLDAGRRAAQEQGISCPTVHESIIWGVDREAQLHPADLSNASADGIQVLLRQALFDLGSTEVKIDGALKDRVYGRLIVAMQSHLAESDSDFNDWFFDNRGGVIHQISKRKRPDGPIDRETVRQTLLEIVADSWAYVGRAVSDLMRNVSMAIDPPLASDDQAAFDVMYRRNSHLGDLPLILLHEQFPELRPAVSAILENPRADEAWGRFLRAFQTFAMISVRRRAADKLRKRSVKITETVSENRSEFTGRYEPDVDPHRRSVFDEIAGELLEMEDAKCSCLMRPDWEARVGSDSTSEIALKVMCRRCGYQCNWKGPRATFELVAKRIRG